MMRKKGCCRSEVIACGGGALPEYLKDLVLRLAFLREGDVQRALIGLALQGGGHLAAHGLNLFMEEAVLPLQLFRTRHHLRHLLLTERVHAHYSLVVHTNYVNCTTLAKVTGSLQSLASNKYKNIFYTITIYTSNHLPPTPYILFII
jgi:hypothetical protein